MPEPYYPKRRGMHTLLDAQRLGHFIRITCRFCKVEHTFAPEDLKVAMGNIDVDDVPYQMRCSRCRQRHTLDIKSVSLSAADRQVAVIRRIDRIHYVRRVTWRDVVGG